MYLYVTIWHFAEAGDGDRNKEAVVDVVDTMVSQLVPDQNAVGTSAVDSQGNATTDSVCMTL